MWKVEERKRQKKEVFQRTAAIYETEWKRVLEGGKAPAATPHSAPEHRYIDRRLHSAIPHFKGKISVYSGPTFFFLSRIIRPADSSDGK